MFPFPAAMLVSSPRTRVTTWNPADLVNVTLSGGNLTATNTASGAVRSTTSLSSGKVSFSATIGAIPGTTRFSLIDSVQTLNNLATVTNGFTWRDNGSVDGSAAMGVIDSFVAGNVIDVCVDIGAKLFWGRVNGGNWNASGAANPATGAGGLSIPTLTGALFMAVGFTVTTPAVCTLNPYPGAYPTGFLPWDAR